TKMSASGLPARLVIFRRPAGTIGPPRAASAPREGPTATSCRKRNPAIVSTTAMRRGNRLSRMSSLRILTTVSKPISGRNRPNATSAVAAVWRNAPRRGRRAARATSSMSHLFDVGAAENALRQKDHDDGKNREGRHILIGAGDVFRPERLDHTDEQSSQ